MLEINKYQDITGVVTLDEIPEGRFVFVATSGLPYHFRSRQDLQAVRVPQTTTEAAAARMVVTHAVDNSQIPMYQPQPSWGDFALRQGFDQTENVPFDATVHLTHPSMKQGVAIPSGYLALGLGPGEFTIGSDDYSASANIVPGAYLNVMDVASDGATDAGKLEYSSSATHIVCVRKYSDGRLTFRILY